MIKVNNLNITVSAKTPMEKNILINNNFIIHENKTTLVIGHSGSGKTTLLQALANLITYDGEILIDNLNVKRVNRSKIGYVSQFSEKQIFENKINDEINFGYQNFFKDKLTPDKINYFLDLVNFDLTKKDSLTHQLSNGERRKIAIASVLAYEPEILILDEPTIALDGLSKRGFIDFL